MVPLSGANSENNNEAKERELESEWDDDAVLVNNSSLSSSSFNSDKVKANTLMNSIKVNFLILAFVLFIELNA